MVLAVIGGLVSWFATGAVLFRLLRWAWPVYAIAEPAMAFDVAMQMSRLAIGVVCSVVAGWLAARVARGKRRAAWMLGILLVMLFLPISTDSGTSSPCGTTPRSS